jgi:hypothetical protein
MLRERKITPSAYRTAFGTSERLEFQKTAPLQAHSERYLGDCSQIWPRCRTWSHTRRSLSQSVRNGLQSAVRHGAAWDGERSCGSRSTSTLASRLSGSRKIKFREFARMFREAEWTSFSPRTPTSDTHDGHRKDPRPHVIASSSARCFSRVILRLATRRSMAINER